MSAPALERIGISSTEEVLIGLQGMVMSRSEAFLELPIDEGDDPEYYRFFAGDNAVASARRTPGHLSVYYANMTGPHSEYSVDDTLELSFDFIEEEEGKLIPLSLTNDGSVKVAINSPASPEPKRQHRYAPKLWTDGGYSLETAPDAPSLDQGSIFRIVEFASQVVDMRLIPYKAPPPN